MQLNLADIVIAVEHIHDTGLSCITAVCLGIPEGVDVLVVALQSRQRTHILTITDPGTADPMLGNNGIAYFRLNIRNFRRRCFIQPHAGRFYLSQRYVSVVVNTVAAGKDQLHITDILDIQIFQTASKAIIILGVVCGGDVCQQIKLVSIVTGVDLEVILPLIGNHPQTGQVIIAVEHISNTGISLVFAVCLGIPYGKVIAVEGNLGTDGAVTFPVTHPGSIDQIIGNNRLLLFSFLPLDGDGSRTFFQPGAAKLDMPQADIGIIVRTVTAGEHNFQVCHIFTIQSGNLAAVVFIVHRYHILLVYLKNLSELLAVRADIKLKEILAVGKICGKIRDIINAVQQVHDTRLSFIITGSLGIPVGTNVFIIAHLRADLAVGPAISCPGTNCLAG